MKCFLNIQIYLQVFRKLNLKKISVDAVCLLISKFNVSASRQKQKASYLATLKRVQIETTALCFLSEFSFLNCFNSKEACHIFTLHRR